TIELGVPGDFADFQVSCGAPGANEGLTIGGAGTNRIGIELGEGARPVCTWYIIGENAAGFTPTPVVTPAVTPAPTAVATAPTTPKPTAAATRPAGPVSNLPDTGTGADSPATADAMLYLVIVGMVALAGVMASRRIRVR
ncbi:MAG TPA: hypothetical protein VGR16_15405, partial [Thermomicrobiales bacterium]|nr:hypothetical protein [Thermomicrobiales bacterium]